MSIYKEETWDWWFFDDNESEIYELPEALRARLKRATEEYGTVCREIDAHIDLTGQRS